MTKGKRKLCNSAIVRALVPSFVLLVSHAYSPVERDLVLLLGFCLSMLAACDSPASTDVRPVGAKQKNMTQTKYNNREKACRDTIRMNEPNRTTQSCDDE